MRIGLALVLLVGLVGVARADRVACPRPLGESAFVGDDLPVPISWSVDPDPRPGDKTPPEHPTNAHVRVAPDGSETRISLEGNFPSDVVYIRVAFDHYMVVTTPGHMEFCIHHEVKPGARARIVVIDQSANQSSNLTVDTQAFDDQSNAHVLAEQPAAQALEEPHHHDHHGMDILITVGAIVLAGMELVGLVLIGFARKKAPFSVAGEFLSPILAENVARGVARGYLIKLTVAMLIIIGLLGLHHLNIAILVGPFAIIWLFELFLTRLVIAQFDSKIQRLEKRELWIYINSSKLWAPYKIWEKASALPSAGLAKRD